MFNTLEAKWNARTPVWLHNGTKENIIFQLTAAVVLCSAMFAWDEYKDRRDFPELHKARKKNRK